MKKALLLMLALIMVLSSFVACGSPDTPPAEESKTPGESGNNPPASGNDTEGPAGTTAPDGPSTPAETQIGNLDPNIDLGGKEVTIISRSHYHFADEVAVEESSGDPIESAIFQRNLDVERILNCTLENFKVTESSNPDYAVVTQLKNTIGPDCPYDIMSASAYTAFENTAAGLCHNLLDVEHIDLNQHYWAPYYNEEATIGNQQYFATGAISLALRRFIFVTFFNPTITADHGIEDLYTVVNDGRWTLDYQAEIVNGVFSELDGVEGKTEGDFYGFVTNHHICVDPYWAACDATILDKDDDDYLIFAPEKEKLDNILTKLKQLYRRSGGTYSYSSKSGDADQNDIRAKFTSEYAMMVTLRLLECEADDFRNMEAYGILPMPKFDETQENYYSHAHDQFAVYGIVSSVPTTEIDNMGAVLECMAIEGYRTVTPAYFEIALKGKYSKDPQSWDMLDKIVNNLKIDGGLLYTIAISDITQQLRNVVKNDSPTVSTVVFSAFGMKALNRSLDRFITSVRNLQGA